MDPISIVAASGMRARLDALDLLANNLANGATVGYKADRESYGHYAGEDATNAVGDSDSSATIARIDRQWTDFSQGEVQSTGNPLDFAITGRGFFAVNGPNGALYTRNGSFLVSHSGTLTTAQGYEVRSVGGSAIQVQPKGDIEVSTDGTVSQAGKKLGRLEVVDFAKPDSLSKQSGTYFQATASAMPQAATQVEVRQGATEGSNVSVAESTMRMLGMMRQFEMLQKAVTMSAEMGRQSVEQVAKVS